MGVMDLLAVAVILGLVALVLALVAEQSRLLGLLDDREWMLGLERKWLGEAKERLGDMRATAIANQDTLEARLADAEVSLDETERAGEAVRRAVLEALGVDAESSTDPVAAARDTARELDRLRSIVALPDRCSPSRPIGEIANECGYRWPDGEDSQRNVLEAIVRMVRYWRARADEATRGVMGETMYRHMRERCRALARKLRNVRRDAADYRRGKDWHAQEERGVILRLLAGEDVPPWDRKGDMLGGLAAAMKRLRELEAENERLRLVADAGSVATPAPQP